MAPAKRVLRKILSLLFICFTLCTSQVALSAELDESANMRLEKILEDKLFQPREDDKPWLEEKIVSMLENFVEQLKDLFSAGANSIKDRQSSDFFDILLQMLHDFSLATIKIAKVLFKFALYAAWAFLLGFLGLKLYKKLSRENKARSNAESSSQSSTHSSEQPDYFSLLQAEQLDQALVALRQTIRLELKNKFACPTSLTDREAGGKIPQASPLASLFLRMIKVFERQIYAGQGSNKEEIIDLANAHRELK